MKSVGSPGIHVRIHAMTHARNSLGSIGSMLGIPRPFQESQDSPGTPWDSLGLPGTPYGAVPEAQAGSRPAAGAEALGVRA